MSTLEISFKLPYKLVPENNLFTALCPVLDVASQGETKEEAKENLLDALVLFIETCYETGTLCEVLKASGFEKAEGQSKVANDKNCVSDDLDYLDVPISLLAASTVNQWHAR